MSTQNQASTAPADQNIENVKRNFAIDRLRMQFVRAGFKGRELMTQLENLTEQRIRAEMEKENL